MIENPIIEALILIFFGFNLGIIVYQFYLIRVGKNILQKLIALIGVKVKASDVTLAQALNIISNILSKLLEEVKDEESKTKFKDTFTENDSKHI